MPKVLFVTNDLSLGGETSFVGWLTQGLMSRGFSVGCIVTETKGEYYEEFRNIFDYLVNLSQLPLGLRRAVALAEAIRSYSPQFLILSARTSHFSLPLLDPKIRAMPILHLDNPNFYRRAARFPRRISSWICDSPRVAAGMRQYLPQRHAERIRNVPYGVDRDLFEAASLPVEQRKTDLLFVGVLYEHKGAHWLPDILERGGDDLLKARFVVVGDGELKHELQARFTSLGVAAQFLGFQPIERVAAEMGSAKVMLFPTQVEGLPLVLLEAMMAGAVPVTSHLEGVTDAIVDDGRTGFLVPPGDLGAYASRAAHLIKNQGAWRAMSEAAQARAQEYFSIEAMVDRYLQLFAEPDLREAIKRRSMLGWALECAGQELREGIAAGTLGSHLKALLFGHAA